MISIKKSKVPVALAVIAGMTGLVLAVYFSAKANSGVVLWLLMPLEIIPVGFKVDYGTWRLVLKEDIIEYSSLRQKKKYHYSQIEEITESYSNANNQYALSVFFSSGKRITIYSSYQNYQKARGKLLQKHSIKSIR